MNYPIWDTGVIGGGSLIALISVVHVYIAHLAVGGGIFIWLLDRKAYLEQDERIDDFLRSYNWIFLLITMVFGGVTGVGIWFIIALVSPAATSVLIHNFVFGWATEWVFFLGEIIALLVYHYYFDKLARKTRLNIAFLYAIFAWLSLFIINGILSFMLTPGKWLETGNFWQGFFNPTFFSSLFFRTFITVAVAGISAFLIGSFQKDDITRRVVIKTGITWIVTAIAGLILSSLWYYYSIPADLRIRVFDTNPETMTSVSVFFIMSAVLLVIGLFYMVRAKPVVQRVMAFIMVVCGLIWMGGFEYSREIARKPYVINGYMFSNSIFASQAAKLNETGILNAANWNEIKRLSGDARNAGKEIFTLQCSACHSVGGIRNDIIPKTAEFTFLGMNAQLNGQGKMLNYMPPFLGTDEEKKALSAYIVKGLHGKELIESPDWYEPKAVETDIPPMNDEYVLLAWSTLGMRCMTDGDAYFAMFPPGNTFEAQLIKRGDPPQIITKNVIVKYTAEDGFKNPSGQVDFWNYANLNYGKDIELNIGLSGLGMDGDMTFLDDRMLFQAQGVPVVPYMDDETFNPYPLFNLTAYAADSNRELAMTKMTSPVSTEMGCRNCHGGDWRIPGGPGIGKKTVINILKAHDRIEGTKLYEEALAGNPRLCQSCHADPLLKTAGTAGVLNFSAAMHGWHANYMPVSGSEACALCHPSSPAGFTRCLRGIHQLLEIGCVSCHGSLELHAAGLLKKEIDKSAAPGLMAKLDIPEGISVDNIKSRMPWGNEPDCLNCHVDFEQPAAGAVGYNNWTSGSEELFRMRSGNAGIQCAACHGSPHAEYPAVNAYRKNPDVIQPLQYMGSHLPIGSDYNCKVCHTVQYDEAVHHENMARKFRNSELADKK